MTHGRSPVFLDAVYLLALSNTRDQWFGAAARWEEWMTLRRQRLITTEFVLAEFGDGLAAARRRRSAVGVIDALVADSRVEIVSASSELFTAALTLYRSRLDQAWGLTDCSSFVVMRERGLSAALTADDHFRQAGFRALLLDEPPR